MIYVMSDIHGEYSKFLSMLDRIKFSNKDTLYIIGDILDRGPEPIKLLTDLSMRDNVFPLLGNHEYMAIDVLRRLMVEVTEGNFDSYITPELMEKIIEWQINGGEITMSQFQKLPLEKREGLLEYLEEFSLVESIDVGNKTFVLVHAGFDNFDINKSIYDYSPEELIFNRPNYNMQLFDDSVFVVSGHTPTITITGQPQIYHNKNNICIDCGATFDGKLACLCLNTMQEYYIL